MKRNRAAVTECLAEAPLSDGGVIRLWIDVSDLLSEKTIEERVNRLMETALANVNFSNSKEHTTFEATKVLKVNLANTEVNAFQVSSKSDISSASVGFVHYFDWP